MMLDRLTDTNLNNLAEAAERHVQQAFGERLDLDPVASGSLPHFVTDRYRLWRGKIAGQPATFAAMRRTGQGITAEYLKHREVIRKHLGRDLVLLLLDHPPKTSRQQMIRRRIGFIAPGTQVYVPEMLLDLHERSPTINLPKGEQFSPTTQSVVLALLLGKNLENLNLTDAADKLRVSIMSISRSLDELEALHLARSHRVGRERRLKMIMHGRELWEAVLPRLQSPVRKTRMMRGAINWNDAPLAGESALARYTMLAAPRIETRAVLSASWKRLVKDCPLDIATPFDEDRFEIQTWTYDPAVLAEDGVIDRLSLYLTVRDSPNERVAQAADELLETFSW